MKKLIYTLLILILYLKLGVAAHYIVGYAEDGLDGEPSNGKTVLLWNPENGISDNQTDIIGPTGNSNTNNLYMIDCELLQTPCTIQDNISIKIIQENGYYSNTINISISGAGYDLAENLTLNSPIEIISTEVDDNLLIPINEIDLTPAQTKEITCISIAKDYDGEDEIFSATAKFFSTDTSFYGDTDDNNQHYTYYSCQINKTYGDSTQAKITCKLQIQYYSNPQNWNCTTNITDNNTFSTFGQDATIINTLLALGVNSPINFGEINVKNVSNELALNITNYGNIQINLSLNGYGATEGDNKAMNCSGPQDTDIPIYYEKYNLTTSTPGALSLTQLEQTYSNLTTSPTIKTINLNHRQNDTTNEAIQETYWRIFVPQGTLGSCSGNIIFGATQAPGS